MERKTIDGVHFIRAKGNAVEFARAHGTLLREEIRNGAMPALAKKNEWLIRRSPGIVQKPPVQNAVVWFYRNVLIPFLDRSVDEETRQVIRALAESAGLPYEVCRESVFQADGLMLLSRISVMKYLLRDLPAGGLPGCTSGFVSRQWTQSGRMLVCRNLDYPVVGPWEKNPTVLFQEPDERGQIPHVSLTTAGVHTSGLTSMNREGITLAAHAHFARSVSLRGTTVVHLGDQIIRRARTIGEAVDIARKTRRYANWAYVVSSAKENDAVVIEMTPDKTYVTPAEGGFLVHSNFFHSKELRGEEALISGACCDDLVSRICRLREILEPLRGRIEPAHMTAALGDHVDIQTGEERVFGNTLGVTTTIKSAVFEPESQKFWISTRKESPVGLNSEFLEVDVERFWSEPHPERRPRLQGYRPKNPELIEGVRHYRDAYIAWHMNAHEPDFAEKTLISLRKAVRAYPSDGHVLFQAGLVAFQMKHFEEARTYFSDACKRTLAKHSSSVCHLFFARCLDLLGHREQALEIYRAYYQQAEEPKLRKAFRRGLKRPYREKEVELLMIDMQFPDTMQY